MRFFITRGPIEYKGKRYVRSDKYIDMPYDEARPYIVKRQLMKAGTQPEEKKDAKTSKKNSIKDSRVRSNSKSRGRSRKSSVRS